MKFFFFYNRFLICFSVAIQKALFFLTFQVFLVYKALFVSGLHK